MPQGDVSRPATRNKSQFLVESVHSRISATALHQNVVAVVDPSLRERGLDDSAAMATTAEIAMSDHVL
jgi:hypothetical protein